MATEKKETKKKTPAKKPAAKKTTAPKAPKKKIDAPVDPMDDIKMQETIQNAPESLQKPSEYKVVCKSVLNVRGGSGKEYKVIRQIPNGSSVFVYEQKDGFGRIGDGEWIMMSFLKREWA